MNASTLFKEPENKVVCIGSNCIPRSSEKIMCSKFYPTKNAIHFQSTSAHIHEWIGHLMNSCLCEQQLCESHARQKALLLRACMFKLTLMVVHKSSFDIQKELY